MFPTVDPDALNAAFAHLFGGGEGVPVDMALATRGFFAMEAAYAAQYKLTPSQRRVLRGYTARWFMMGVLRNKAGGRARSILSGLWRGRVFGPALLTESAAYARRRWG